VSKIFEAIENARRGESAPDKPESRAPSVSLPVSRQPGRVDVDMESEMISLYQTITAALPGINHRSVLFVGSRSNEGTSTVARELAKAASLRMEKNVLLIDLDRSRPEHHIYTKVSRRNGDEDVPEDKEKAADPMEDSLCQVEESSLYVMPLFQKTMVTPRTLDSAKGQGFWEPLKERFDLIIVDSPPTMMFPDGPAVASQVDGVILVVEAEKTRWQVALSVKEKIEKSGGVVLGIVFNKRKYYIPQFIYKHL